MDRLFVRAAALAAVALMISGCSTNPLDAFALTGPAAEQTAKKAGDAAQTPDLADNLDNDISKAQALRAKGDLDGATHVLAQLMLAAPDDPRVIGEYGKVLAQAGRSSDAAAFLKRAVQLQPDDWSLYSALGVVYDQLDDHEKARVAYGNALRLNPGAPSVLNNFALSRMLAGDLPMAASLSAEAAAKDPGNAKIAANRDMIAGMLKARGEDAPAPGPQAAESAPEAPVAMKPLPVPEGAASAAPKPLGATANITRLDGHRVVMEKVPFDPDAGPVKEAAAPKAARHAPRKLAHDGAPTLKKRIADDSKNSIPALRTAAD
jgi:Flp pilus assembly protein TadD